MIDHWFGRFKNNLWQESDRMELVEEEDVLGLGYWAASAFGDWLNGTLNRWISNTLETNRPAGNVHLFPLKHNMRVMEDVPVGMMEISGEYFCCKRLLEHDSPQQGSNLVIANSIREPPNPGFN